MSNKPLEIITSNPLDTNNPEDYDEQMGRNRMINNSYINSNITSPNENSMIVHGSQGEFTPVSTQ